MHVQVASRGPPGRRVAHKLHGSVPGLWPLIVTLPGSGICVSLVYSRAPACCHSTSKVSLTWLVLRFSSKVFRTWLVLWFSLTAFWTCSVWWLSWNSSLSAPEANLYQPHCPVHCPSD